MAVPIKSPDQIKAMARAGHVLDGMLRDLRTRAVAGQRTRDLHREAASLARARGVTPALLGYACGDVPAFPGAACINVNEEVTHAVPSARILRDWDVVTIDCAIRAGDASDPSQSWCIDAAITHVVVGASSDPSRQARAQRMAHAARATLDAALERCVAGASWSSVVASVHDAASRAGVSIVPGCQGHGVGKDLHEPPALSFDLHAPAHELMLRPGMVLCLEPVVCETPLVTACVTLDDGWTVVTHDRSWTAFEEACIAITLNGPRVLAGAAWRSDRG